MNEPITVTDEKKKRRKAIFSFLGSAVVALALTFLIKEPQFTDSQLYVLFLMFFAIGLWITEAIPPFAVSLFIIAYLVFTLGNPNLNSAPQKIDRYVNTFSSSIIWLLLGGFFMATAMTKTKLDQQLLRATLLLSGTKPRNILVAVMFTTMTASMLMSNTATAAMVVAAIMPLVTSIGKSGFSKALLLGVSIAATVGGMGTIIGTPPNAIAAGILENSGQKIDFLTWMKYGIPVAIALTAISCFVLLRIFVKKSAPVSFEFMNKQKTETTKEPTTQRRIVMVVIIITILFWLTTSVHGITVAAISAIPIVVLTLTGVLDNADIKKLPWDTLLLVAGGLSLGEALQSTGIMDHYANQLRTLSVSTTAFIFILCYATMIFSNIMSNSATATVLIPLGMAILIGFESQVAIAIGLATSTALFLPVSTPPNAIVYSTGLLEQKDFRIGGILIAILGPLLAVLWVLFLHR
ncbi:MAG: DASS family sodium-coupled anion symporter [Bacteroidetes bacterium]|nr:MAG: DASS family sodium-coupled anion symporter [Bacteroidota bacterium]